jgi:serine/threonine protein kinase
MIPGYTHVKYLASGTYGDVNKYQKDGKDVAIKSQELSIQEGIFGAVLREADLVSRISHPHIITLKEKMISSNKMLMVLPFYQQDMSRFLRGSTRYQVCQHLLSITKKLVSTLAFIHKNRIYHCDIKPANVLLQIQDDTVDLALVDFGLAMVNNGNRTKVCTCIYRPPEIFFSRKKRLFTDKIDVWSLGMSLLELVIGKYALNPEQGEDTIPENIFKIVGLTRGFAKKFSVDMTRYDIRDNFLHKFIRRKNTYVDPLFIDLLSCMLKIDPDKRWSAEELLDHPYFTHQDDSPQPEGELKLYNALPVTVQPHHVYDRKQIILMVKRIARSFTIPDQSVILGIHLFDKYLELRPLSANYDITMALCLSLATNYIEGSGLAIEDLYACMKDNSDCRLSRRLSVYHPDMMSCQKHIVETLNWTLGYTTLYDIVTTSDHFRGKEHIIVMYSILMDVNLLSRPLEELANLALSHQVQEPDFSSDSVSDDETEDETEDEEESDTDSPLPDIPTSDQHVPESDVADIQLCVQDKAL